MCALARVVTLAVGLTGFVITGALADPTPSPDYQLETVRKSGAIFSGLAKDGDALLVTNLADGRLYRRESDGHFRTFGPELPHGLDVMGEPAGPYRAKPFGKRYLVAQGWTPLHNVESPNDHALLEVDDTGVARIVRGDFWNPFDFVVDDDSIFVIDSGKNTLERLGRAGDKTTVFTFPRLKHEGQTLGSLSPTEFSGKEPYEVDAVPTGIAEREGRLYVSLFGGFPYIAGGGGVISLDKSKENIEARLEIGGLDTPVGLAFDSTGRLLILEHGRFDQATGFVSGSGRLFSVDLRTGDRKTLVGGLTRPVTVLVLDDTTIAISELGDALIILTRKRAE